MGESGCGKTTTGRSIIKLYKITSDVYFENTRIRQTLKLEEELKEITRRIKPNLKAQRGDEAGIAAKPRSLTSKDAKRKKSLQLSPTTNSNRAYAAAQVEKLNAEYEPKFAACPEGERENSKKSTATS
ncbi:MAG: hypothetical protein ACLUSP_07920 [Christensenellales bacterium]